MIVKREAGTQLDLLGEADPRDRLEEPDPAAGLPDREAAAWVLELVDAVRERWEDESITTPSRKTLLAGAALLAAARASTRRSRRCVDCGRDRAPRVVLEGGWPCVVNRHCRCEACAECKGAACVCEQLDLPAPTRAAGRRRALWEILRRAEVHAAAVLALPLRDGAGKALRVE